MHILVNVIFKNYLISHNKMYFVIRNFRGTCSSVEVLKEYMFRGR